MMPSLEYFTYIAKYNNITRAAQELHITQQCLSNYLKKLEEYYGLPLFTRKPSMALTAFGRTVYKRALMIQGIQNEIEASIPYHQNDNPIGIGFSIMHIFQAMDLFDMEKFIENNKGAAIRLRHGSLETLAAMLRSGEVDVYFTSFTHAGPYPISTLKPAGDFITKDVRSFDYKAVVTYDTVKSCFGSDTDDIINKWQTEGTTVPALSVMPLVMLNQLQKPFFNDSRERGYKLRLAAECDNVHLTMRLAKEGLGFAVVPSFTDFKNERDDLLQFRVTDPATLSSSAVFACTTETSLEREIVRNLWDMIGSPEDNS